MSFLISDFLEKSKIFISVPFVLKFNLVIADYSVPFVLKINLALATCRAAVGRYKVLPLYRGYRARNTATRSVVQRNVGERQNFFEKF